MHLALLLRRRPGPPALLPKRHRVIAVSIIALWGLAILPGFAHAQLSAIEQSNVAQSAAEQFEPALTRWIDAHRRDGEEVQTARREASEDRGASTNVVVSVLFTGIGGGNGTEVWLLWLQDGQVVASRNLSQQSRRPLVVDALALSEGQLTVSARRVGPRDAWCCPSEHREVHYRLDAGRIVLAD